MLGEHFSLLRCSADVHMSSSSFSETCIKGHRASTCKHIDRPLYEIQRKGRPATQCDHCRELRRTKQLHVKCTCDPKQSDAGTSSSASSGTKKGESIRYREFPTQLTVKYPWVRNTGAFIPTSPAFPTGLPESLAASVVDRPLSASSDSEHGMTIHPCSQIYALPHSHRGTFIDMHVRCEWSM